ncbi:MAG: O-antigen ligase family protein [Bacteroidales bacterium]|jgi:O-antigen ligase
MNIKIKPLQHLFVCLYFASINFEVFSPFIEDFSIAKMASFLYFGVSLLTPEQLFRTDKIKKYIYLPLLLFLLITLVSLFNINYYSYSFFNTTLLLNIIMFWLLLNHYRRDNRIFDKGFMWFVIGAALVGTFYLLGIGVEVGYDGRITVFGDNANEIGVKMAVASLFLINYTLNNKYKKIYKPYYLILLIPIVSLLIATASRVAFISFFLGIVLFVALKKTKKIYAKLLIMFVGVVLIILGFNYLQQTDATILLRLDKSVNEGNLGGRDEIWSTFMPVIIDNPIFGVGITGTTKASTSLFGAYKSPHNVFIEVLLYSGIVGLIIFLIFLFYFYKNAYLYYKYNNILYPLLLSIPVMGLLLSGQLLGVKLAWLIFAITLSRNLSIRNYNIKNK